MHASFTVRGASSQRGGREEAVAASSIREYRRDRQHLYPLEEYRAALAAGGVVTSYCGLDVTVRRGDPADVVEVAVADVDDCVTCVDVWLGSDRVRL